LPDIIIYASALHGPRPPTVSKQPRTGMEWAKWMGPAVRSVIIKLRSAFHVSRPSARNHLSFVDDDCRAGPAAPPSLFLPPSPHEPRHTSTKFMQHAKKMKENVIKENPHERAHHATTLTTTTTDERTNEPTSRCTCRLLLPFLPPRLIYSNHSIDTSL
jgi:hypothetical protein